jgi:drug/metabolite transporter (DMT)-like permease
VLAIGQVVAAVIAAVVAIAAGGAIRGGDVGYGFAAGVVNVIGLAWLYYGLAHGRVSVVAPLTAVVAALLPVTWALVRGERPSALVLVGAAFAITAGAVIARDEGPPEHAAESSGVMYAIFGGAFFGASFIFYSEASGGSGFWPVLSARVAAVAVVAIALVATRDRRVPAGSARSLALGAGVLDVTAGILELVALREGLLAIVAPVVALAPAFTVILAWALLRERVSRAQVAGLALALVGLVLVAAG